MTVSKTGKTKISLININHQQYSMSAERNISYMIKGNLSDVGNINFEFKAKTGDKCLCFLLFSTSIQRIGHISVIRYSSEMGLESKHSI